MPLKLTRHLAPALIALAALSGLMSGAVPATAPITLKLDSTHPLTMQRAANLVATAQTGAPKPFVLPKRRITTALPNTLHSGPHREIFGFALASSLSDPTFGYPSWDFSLLSTVAFFGLHVQTDGNFAHDAGWSTWYSSDETGLLTAAHAAGTKVVLTIILQDFSANTPNMCAGLAHAASTVADTVAEVAAKGVDGVNVDYEGLNGSCGTGDPSWARHALPVFVANLRAALPGGSYLSVDTYASSATDPLGFFDIATMAPSVDSFFVMAYDLEYSNAARAPLGCSGFCLGPTAPLTGYYYNDTSTAAQYIAAVPASKVILGVPYYGRKACVASPTANQNPNPADSVIADSYLDASTEAVDPQVKAGSYVSHRDANDPGGQEKWDTWFNTSLNCTRELYWDDPTSLGYKYDLVIADNLRGVGIWNLNYGGGAPELWSELDMKFGTANPWTSLGGIVTSSPASASSGANATDVFVRGTDNALWHRKWNGTTWSPWDSLGGTLIADPSAVSRGPNSIDVFVIGTDHGIWHRSWNGTAWAAWDSVGGYATSGAAAASWGVGRLDLVVRGTDNGLWHRAWNGASWGAWDQVGGTATSDPSAVVWGPGRLDVFVRGTDNALWHRAIDGTGTPWSVWESQGGILTSGPDAASCAPGHLDVFVTGTNGGLWHKGFGGAWGTWAGLRGMWTSDPSAVCAPGTTAVFVFERGPDSGVWQSIVPGS